jgi:uncharacterized protein YciI
MKALRSRSELLAAARQQEQAGEKEAAAALYEKVLEQDPADRQAVSRLLTIYRKDKDYRKELRVIDAALEAYARQDKTVQTDWLKAHPKAAGAGRAILRKLGGPSASGFGTNPTVNGLMKRKEVVEGRISGKPRKRKDKTGKRKEAAPGRKQAAGKRKEAAPGSKEAAAKKRADAAEKRQQAAIARKQVLLARKKAAEDRRRMADEKKKAAAEAKRKAAGEAKKKAAAARPPLFVITLRYLVTSEKIEEMAEAHQNFLAKHSPRTLLVFGRQSPPTGEIIIARAKNRDAVDRLMKQDPFVKKKLASIDILAFSPEKDFNVSSSG